MAYDLYDSYDSLTSMTSMTFISRCSSVVEHFLGKEEAKGSIPFNGSNKLVNTT